MASNQDQDPQASSSSHTLRSGLGTQLNHSYSAEEMANPSGEENFNFRPTGSAEALLSRGGSSELIRVPFLTVMSLEK